MAEGCTVATRKLSKKFIDALPARDRVYIAYDDSLPGFGCRVTVPVSLSAMAFFT